MNATFSGFVCVEAIMYLLLHNLHDCVHSTFFSVGGHAAAGQSIRASSQTLF